MTYWTQQWSSPTARDELSITDNGRARVLDHTSSNSFVQTHRQVEPGDTIYVLSYSAGSLHVHGRLVVASLVSQGTAEAHFGEPLSEADWHVIAVPGLSTRLNDALVPHDDVLKLTFISPAGTRSGPALNRDGAPDPQAFRGVREIEESSAQILEVALHQATGASGTSN